MTQTKRKKKNIRKQKKTRRRGNVPKDNQLLSNSVKEIINDKLYKHYRDRAINDPSAKNLEGLEIVLEHSIKKDLTKKKSIVQVLIKNLFRLKVLKSSIVYLRRFVPFRKTVSSGKIE